MERVLGLSSNGGPSKGEMGLWSLLGMGCGMLILVGRQAWLGLDARPSPGEQGHCPRLVPLWGGQTRPPPIAR